MNIFNFRKQRALLHPVWSRYSREVPAAWTEQVWRGVLRQEREQRIPGRSPQQAGQGANLLGVCHGCHWWWGGGVFPWWWVDNHWALSNYPNKISICRPVSGQALAPGVRGVLGLLWRHRLQPGDQAREPGHRDRLPPGQAGAGQGGLGRGHQPRHLSRGT